MGPKGKNKKTKEVIVKDPDEVTNLEKEFFEFQLAEIEKKIQRINTREEELKQGTIDFEQKIEDHKKEKGLIISEHEQLLLKKEEEKMQKREEMCQLAEEIKIRIEKHKQHIEELKENYRKMVAELTEKIEEQEEEIKTQEDFKQNKELYEGKLEELEKAMIEAELQHQRNLFEIEKKFDTARKRVKKELQFRLIHLSIEFQEVTKKKVGNPCHRATQENKAIQNALIQMEEEIMEYQNRCVISKNNMKLFKGQKDKKQLEKDKMIARTLIQVSVIKTLQEDRKNLIKILESYDVVVVENKQLLKKLHEVSNEVEKVMASIEQTNQKIENKTQETNEMNEAVSYLKKRLRRLGIFIRNGRKIAEEAVAVRLIPLGKMEEEKYMPMEVKIRLFNARKDVVFAKKGKILRYLLEFLSKGQITEDDKKYMSIKTDDLEIDIDIDFTEVFGRTGEEEVEELKVSVEEGVEKGPLFLTSLTSMSRSVTIAVVPEKKVSEREMFGEGEEEGEGEGELGGEEEEDEEDRRKRMDLEYVGEDFEILGEEEEDEDEEEQQQQQTEK